MKKSERENREEARNQLEKEFQQEIKIAIVPLRAELNKIIAQLGDRIYDFKCRREFEDMLDSLNRIDVDHEDFNEEMYWEPSRCW